MGKQQIRKPYHPTREEWTEVFIILCGHCIKQTECQIVEGMIELQQGGEWPEGGWVTDPGAEVTCLSYEPRRMKTLSNHELIHAIDHAAPMCSDCAAQKGSEASVSLHTQRDFKAAVQQRAMFACHCEGQKGRPCGGWAQAVSKQVQS